MHVGVANLRWRGKRSRHSRRMRNPQYYVSSMRPMETNLFTTKLLYAQYLGCCCDGYKRSQIISVPGIDLVCPGYSGFRLSRATYISVCPRLEFTPTIALGLNQQSLYSRMMTSSNINIFRVTDPLVFSLICAWTNGWVKNRDTGGLRRILAHYDVTVIVHRTHTHQLIQLVVLVT